MNKSLSPNSSIVNRSIDLNYANKQRAESIKWIFVNIVLFLLFAYDLWWSCYAGPLQWVEGAVGAALAANVAQHAWRVVRARRYLPPPPRRPSPPPAVSPSTPSRHDTVALCAARAWRTPDPSPPPSPPSPPSPFSSSPRLERLSDSDEFIADQRSLANYLREQEERARVEEAGEAGWAPAHHHPLPHYQLAPLHNSEGSPLEEGAGAAQAAGAWRRLRLDPQRVAHFEQNLRLWLHLTVLRRLEQEMARVDEALGALGPPELRLGHAPLERLRRVPAAAALLPYLERFADQRYVVRRVRELARGGCLSAYRWAGGGPDWDAARPPDAELLLQLLAVYLDAQLPPAPHARAFSSAHLSAAPDPPPRGPDALVVHRVTEQPPHYVLVCGDDVIEVSRGRNNLLHTVLLLVAAAARRDPPALQRLHLGPAGLNLLWVIGR